VLDAIALRFTDGYAARRASAEAGPGAASALDVNTGEARRWLVADGRANTLIAMELWDFDLGIP
jgi:hypothetical protein